MTSLRKSPLDTSVTHHFAADSPYDVPATLGRAASRKQVQMHEISGVSRYYGINRPFLTPSKKRLIEEKLKLDEKVRLELENRKRDQNFFAKFHRNPFSFEQNYGPYPDEVFEEEQRKRHRGKPTYDRKGVQETKDTIVRAVNELTHTSFLRETSPLRLNASYNNFGARMLKTISESQLRSPLSPARREKAKEGVRETTLEDILAMNDENFFAARQGSINIFQVMRGTHRPFLTRDSLDKLHFNFTHLVDRIDAKKFPLLRDLARVGRDLVQDRVSARYNRIDFINSKQMAVKYGEIRVEDLLSIASGRFNAEIAYAAANQGDVRKDFSPTSSEVCQAEILYNSRVRHKKQNCENPLQQRHEIEAYHLIEDTAEEGKFDRFCARIEGSIRSDMNMRGTLLRHTIKDRRMHSQIQAAVQENIGYLANLNNRRKDTPTHRIISQNKVSKNRKETLQIRHLLQSIQLKNREEDKIRQLLHPA